MKGLFEDLEDLYKGASTDPSLQWENVGTPSPQSLSSILGDSPALAGAAIRPPVLETIPTEANFFEEVRIALMDSQRVPLVQVFKSKSSSELARLALGAAAVEDYNFLWKLLKFISKDHWHLISLDSYHQLAQVLSRNGNKESRKRTANDQLFRLLTDHLRLHPHYATPELYPTALYIASMLSRARPAQAMRLYGRILGEFGSNSVCTSETALSELELASNFPYLDTLCLYVERARNEAHKLPTEEEKTKAHWKISSAFVRGLISCNELELAADILLHALSIDYSASNCKSAAETFIHSYKMLLSEFSKRDIAPVERMIGLISRLPQPLSNGIEKYELFEWILEAHANAKTGRMNDIQAFETLECMALVSGITSRACNSYLAIVAANDTLHKSKIAIEAQIEVLFQKYVFLPDVSTFKLLLRSCTNLEDALVVFNRACFNGQLDADLYGSIFEKLSTVPRRISTQNGSTAVADLIKQFQESEFEWSTAALSGILDALSSHRLYEQLLHVYQISAARGEVQFDTKIANLALDAAQRLGGAEHPLVKDLAHRMEKNLDRLFAAEPATAPNLNAAISSSSYGALNAPNSELVRKITSVLPKKEVLELEALIGVHPRMVLDARTFNLISLHGGHRVGLLAKLTSEHYNIIPTTQTYVLLLRSCKRTGDWLEMTRVLASMLHHHRKGVTDSIVAEIFQAIVLAGNLNRLRDIKALLQQYNIPVPETSDIKRTFTQSL